MLDIFDLLFFSGADVNNPCHRYQRTPIMYAVVWGDVRSMLFFSFSLHKSSVFLSKNKGNHYNIIPPHFHNEY